MAALQANITAEGAITSLQISKIGNVPTGHFNPGRPFLLKVNQSAVPQDPVTIVPAGQKTPISTLLFPGWNPEICTEVIGYNADYLQFGY